MICVFKIMFKIITSSEFIENMCYFHFQMQVCAHVVMCGSNENYFGQCLPINISKCGHFYTLCVCIIVKRQGHISNLRLSRHINCSNTNYSDKISVQKS